MTYSSVQQLPEGIVENLPPQGQVIYQKTYNNAYKIHKDAKNPESIAHRIAWSAVKQEYEQVQGKWKKKPY